jgi:hypothetical protein
MSYRAISWYENPEFDVPSLKSPQPCIHGAGCVFTVKNAEGVVKPGCCHFVHPGEEGNGRRLFPAKDGKPACVRLTGKAGFYERCRLKMSWQEWCERQGIHYEPNEAGVHREPVKRFPIGKLKQNAVVLRAELRSVLERVCMLVKASMLDDKLKQLNNVYDMHRLIHDADNIIDAVMASIDVMPDAEAGSRAIADGAFAKLKALASASKQD